MVTNYEDNYCSTIMFCRFSAENGSLYNHPNQQQENLSLEQEDTGVLKTLKAIANKFGNESLFRIQN